MLQSIVDNNQKNDPLNKKSTKNGVNKTKDVMSKRPHEDNNKKDTLDKTVGNLAKIISDTTVKNQQIYVPTPHKKCTIILVNFRNLQHKCA